MVPNYDKAVNLLPPWFNFKIEHGMALRHASSGFRWKDVCVELALPS